MNSGIPNVNINDLAYGIRGIETKSRQNSPPGVPILVLGENQDNNISAITYARMC
jgi:hypothetical protein